MKKLMKHSLFLLLCSALFVPRTHSVTKVLPGGDGTTAANSFMTAVQAHAFHRPTGTYFAGLANGASANAISYATRPAADAVPTFSGIANANAAATNAEIRTSSITALDVVSDPTNDTTKTTLNDARIVFLSSKANTQALPIGVHCMTVTGGDPVYKPLKDGGGTNATVNTMTLVAGNAGTASYAFVAVKDSDAGKEGNFGASADDGVACVGINLTTNALTEKDHVVCSPLVLTSSTVVGGVGNTAVNGPAMCYDETLKRLYVGLQYQTHTSASHAGGFGVTIYDVNASDGLLTPLLQAGASAATVITPLANDRNIIATKGNDKDIAILNLKVMHTPTGPSAGVRFAYLIVNGGNGAKAAVGNQIWAIPLVVGSAVTPGTPGATNEVTVINGTFASVNTGNFATRATSATDLYTTATRAAKVGNGVLPMAASGSINNMWVDGDAVYCSIGGDPSATNAPGLYVSQPIYNNHGQISYWTEWAKAAPNELGKGVNNGRVGFVAVDAQTSRIWGVNDDGNLLARMTDWESSSFDNTAAAPAADGNGLLTNLNLAANLGDGCTAVCDLNSSSTAWGATTPMRMALFGGADGKICFAITGSAVHSTLNINGGSGLLVSSNTGLHRQFTTGQLDYTKSATLLKTTISGGKTVNSLAYSGWDSNTAASQTNGFFFAATEEEGGLYVWAKTTGGAGFNTRNDIGNFDSDPFRTATGNSNNYRSWQKLDRIAGIPVKIAANGGAVYILTRVGGASPQDRIYRLTRQNTVAALNTDFAVTASTGQGNLASVKRIVDFVISSSASSATAGEQLSILTNDGIYTTTSVDGTNAALNDVNAAQANAGWVQVSTPDTNDTAQFFASQPGHNRDPQTAWYARWAANATNSSVYDKNELYQFSYNRISYKPTLFGESTINAYDLGGAAEPTAFAQNDILTGFYSDGARRLFQRLCGTSYKLSSRPWETSPEYWNMTADHNISAGAAFNDVTYVYWVSPVGDSGKLLAGTNKGVVGLV